MTTEIMNYNRDWRNGYFQDCSTPMFSRNSGVADEERCEWYLDERGILQRFDNDEPQGNHSFYDEVSKLPLYPPCRNGWVTNCELPDAFGANWYDSVRQGDFDSARRSGQYENYSFLATNENSSTTKGSSYKENILPHNGDEMSSAVPNCNERLILNGQHSTPEDDFISADSSPKKPVHCEQEALPVELSIVKEEKYEESSMVSGIKACIFNEHEFVTEEFGVGSSCSNEILPISEKDCSLPLEMSIVKEEGSPTIPCRFLNEQYLRQDQRDCPESTLCDVCGSIVLISLADQHARIHEREQSYFECQKCSLLFITEELLAQHMITHQSQEQSLNDKEQQYAEIVPTFLDLENQPSPNPKRRVRERIWSLCEVCGRGFTTRYSLQAHILRSHSKELPFICDICGQGCISRPDLQQHLDLHAGKKPFLCEKCGKSFGRMSSLYVHRMSHTRPYGRSPVPCPICGKIIGYNLKHHLLTHTNDSPYSCDVCNKRFNQKRSAVRHICVDSEKKKAFSCRSCNAVFTGMADLKQHYRIDHRNERNIQCHLCPKRFYNQFQIKNHVLNFHETKETIPCSVCPKMFKTTYLLRVHERIHTGEKPYKCKFCQRAFSQSSSRDTHQLIHEDKKPFPCQYCDKAFRQSTSFRKHLRQCHPEEMLD